MSGTAAVMITLAIVFVICLILFVILQAAIVATSLHTKFRNAGNLLGRTRADIAAQVGQPNQIENLPSGEQLVQWRQINEAVQYVIVLQFNRQGLCVGIVHESKDGL
jgi:hypothetical protein